MAAEPLAAVSERLRAARDIQHSTLLEKVGRNATSDFGRQHGFAHIHSVADYRRQVPITTYDGLRPYIQRVLEGDITALFAPGTRVLMFAMTSGTTGQPKRLPITAELFDEYKAGWRIWAPAYSATTCICFTERPCNLPATGNNIAPSGVPCGQISGLAATTRPWLTQRAFLLPAVISRIHDPAAKHYTALRLALASGNVGMIATANPSTLLEFARRVERQSESLIRDIHDGTLSCDLPRDVRQALGRRVASRRPARARRLSELAERRGGLSPRDAWPKLSVLAVWTGGSVNVYLRRLHKLYGHEAVRDHGLSASEGRITVPLSDNSSAGLLDYNHSFFEFIPVSEHDRPNPTALEGHELVEGEEYYVVLTTSGGLYRYDIHDIVRCVGFQGQAPVLEFLSKGKHFSSLTGEKLSEHQAIQAVKLSFAELQLPSEAFTLAPVMEERPRYLLLMEPHAHCGRAEELARRVQLHLERVNEEYSTKCDGGRLLPVRVREVPAGTWNALRDERTSERGNFEEYKHPCLVGDLHFVDRVSALRPHSPSASARV